MIKVWARGKYRQKYKLKQLTILWIVDVLSLDFLDIGKNIMGAITRHIQLAKESRENKTTPNNDRIMAYQTENIGNLERQYGVGEISEREYRQRYGEYSEEIRRMGRQ